MQFATQESPASQMSVDDALQAIALQTKFDPRAHKIQAIKELRRLTGLGLKESKDAIDAAFPSVELSLDEILADLERRNGRETAAPSVHDNGHADRARGLKRERDRRYRAHVRERLAASRPPVRPSSSELAWELLDAIPTAQARGWLESAGMTIEIVAMNGRRTK